MTKKTLLVLLIATTLILAVEYHGMMETDGSIHLIHTPHITTGDTINVLDYGADPLDNENDDQPALDQAYAHASNGDEIYFPPGYYNLNRATIYSSTSHFKLKTGVNMRGASKDSVFLISNFPLSLNESESTKFFYGSAVHDIVIEGITFTSTYTGVMPTSVSVNNPDKSAPKYGIYLTMSGVWQPSYNITIRDCDFELMRSQMVRVSTSHDVVVKRCTFSNATDIGGGGAGYGVSIQGEGPEIFRDGYPADCIHNLVDSCNFNGPYIRHGVIIQYTAHNNVVRNSYFNRTGYDAIDLHGEDEYLNDVYGNTVEDVPTGAGVGVGNTGATHDASGRKNHIHHNTFNRCREGVKVYLRSPETQIYDNVADDCSKGVYLLNAPKTNVIGNTFKNGLYGVHLAHDNGTLGDYDGDPDSVAIAGNTLQNNSWGLQINAGTHIMLGENIFINNSVADSVISDGVTFIPYTDVEKLELMPEKFTLYNAYPNPFNPSTTINFQLSELSLVDLKIYDINGKLIETLYNNWADAGKYAINWNAKGQASGVYVLSMTAGNEFRSQKLLLLK
jgi:Periplasmic copper-binding protein (NosD)/Secretion system C-terminal sorting domain